MGLGKVPQAPNFDFQMQNYPEYETSVLFVHYCPKSIVVLPRKLYNTVEKIINNIKKYISIT